MALVIFRSKVAADIVMFAENARRIFEILGRPESAQGVITAAQVPDALRRLTDAVAQEKEQWKAVPTQGDEDGRQTAADLRARGSTLSQRAFPLIQMLQAAEKKNADVTWGT
jgi:Domain of unknown function (DUF1840)